MKLRYLTISAMIAGALLVTACERNYLPIGGESEPLLGAPQSEAPIQLASVRQGTNVSDVAPQSGQEEVEADPAALYVQHCGACHQANGEGIPGAFPPLNESHYVTGDNVQRLAAIMIYGLSGPIEVRGQQYNSAMAPLGATLNDEQLATIATYVRSAWSNDAGPVEAEVFAQTREKWGTRGLFTIEELGTE